ncbi:MAG TPA: aminoacyl-tRNA hydrolase [Verrucomicrobiota bacterium]|nr:aminoacyl-tRNA hydrolase [Verrucomicrobiota bacterium]HNU49613.1 aminoacyl-tRNA hydrolase [Verrucomicrobiota bacterium]
MELSFLIAGLGNPGGAYQRTRHNAGFRLVERLRELAGGCWREEKNPAARLAEARIEGQRGWLCQPLTFMNASGEAVAGWLRYYRVPADRLLVVVDDVDLPLGEIRLRPEGGSGGHHGLESVIQHLGSQAYPRLRLGIGRQTTDRELTGHVLGDFSREEAAQFAQVIERGVDAVRCWLSGGIVLAMNRFNGAGSAPRTKES